MGKLQRWLLEEGLSEEPRTLTDIAHRWYLSTIGRECTDLHVCCDNPEFAPTRSERESVRRAIKRLEEDESRFVRGGGRLWCAGAPPTGWGLSTWRAS